MKIAKNGIRVIKREERERQVQRTTETPEQDVGAELKRSDDLRRSKENSAP